MVFGEAFTHTHTHTDMSDIEQAFVRASFCKEGFACARIPTGDYVWNGGWNGQDLTTYTHTYTHPLQCDQAVAGLMESKEAYVGLWHGISKKVTNCTMKTNHANHLFIYSCDASDGAPFRFDCGLRSPDPFGADCGPPTRVNLPHVLCVASSTC